MLSTKHAGEKSDNRECLQSLVYQGLFISGDICIQKESQYECKKAYNGYMYVNDIVTSDKNSKKLYTSVKGKRSDSSGLPIEE